MDWAAIVAWVQVLDELTYYALLGARPEASPDELKHAFHVFADTFHPDGHGGRPTDEREAIGRIFRRGTEAYRVLENPMLRAQYDASLASGESPLVASRKSSLPPVRERSQGPKSLENELVSPMARPFARRAVELAKKGDWRQAKLQLALALNYEPNNPALTELAKTFEAKIRESKVPPKP